MVFRVQAFPCLYYYLLLSIIICDYIENAHGVYSIKILLKLAYHFVEAVLH